MNGCFARWGVLALVIGALGLVGCLPTGGGNVVGSFDHPVIGEKLVYISGSDGYLYALDKETSDLIWKVAVGDELDPKPLVAGPVLDPDRDIVIVGSEDGNLYAFDATNGGREEWSFHCVPAFFFRVPSLGLP